MMRGRQRRWGRRYEHRKNRGASTPIRGESAAGALARILAVPAVDRALARPLTHPRVLQMSGIVIGIALVLLALRPLIWSSSVESPTGGDIPGIPASAALNLEPVRGQPAQSTADEAVLAVVAAYNQASITAAVLGRVDTMLPFLAPDGRTWPEVQVEYQRRAARGEAHEPALTRWGVLRIAVAGDTATVETQEQWDDITSVSGQVVTSRRGILIRNTYTLRHAPRTDRWLISDVVTTTLIN
jgi:hypothetical protein